MQQSLSVTVTASGGRGVAEFLFFYSSTDWLGAESRTLGFGGRAPDPRFGGRAPDPRVT